MRRSRNRVGIVPCTNIARAFAALLLAAASPHPARAGDAAACWAGFFQAQGFASPVGEIAPVTLAGRTFQLPTAYLWSGVPRAPLGQEDAILLMALAPDLAPPTLEQIREYWRPGSPTLRITVFGDPQRLQGQALLDAMTRFGSYENRKGELDANGFIVLRSTLPGSSLLKDLHLSPNGPADFFACSRDGSVPYPLCTAYRSLGGSFSLDMHFRKQRIPEYPVMSAALDHFMRCALDP